MFRRCLRSLVAPGAAARCTQVVMLETWEHYKKLSAATPADSVHVRIMCPDEVAAALNARIPMRFALEQFLSRQDDGSGAVQERGWWSGSFTQTKSFNRRLLMELLLSDGWSLQHVNTAISEREWVVQSNVLVRS